MNTAVDIDADMVAAVAVDSSVIPSVKFYAAALPQAGVADSSSRLIFRV
jgi:hypothetical protein